MKRIVLGLLLWCVLAPSLSANEYAPRENVGAGVSWDTFRKLPDLFVLFPRPYQIRAAVPRRQPILGPTFVRGHDQYNLTVAVSWDVYREEGFPVELAAFFQGSVAGTGGGGGGGNFSFVASTGGAFYFMAASGCNDANSGLTTSLTWCTPNHAGVKCGDVIIANTGAYSTSGIAVTTSPGTCPSTTGGIDGAGGINFANVVCVTSFACTLNSSSSVMGGQGAIDIAANNWSFQGWSVTTTDKNAWCYSLDAGASGTTQHHHVAFINDICADAGVGFAVQDNGINQNVPGNGGDYFAVLGSLTWKANQRSDFPTASIVTVGMSNINATAGTHVLLQGNFAINNSVTGTSTAYSDLEGMMIDTPESHQYTGQTVLQDNTIYNSSTAGIQMFSQPQNPTTINVYVRNNTTFNDGQCTPSGFSAGQFWGELNSQINGGGAWTLNIQRNIAVGNRATVGCASGGGNMYAYLTGGPSGAVNPGSNVITVGGTGNENIFKGQATSCDNVCNTPNFDVVEFNGYPLGTNFYTSPSFANTTDLLANHLTQPSCSGTGDIASCMGWNFGTQSATGLSVIADLVAGCGSCSGKGYRPPAACAADSLYPSWLKGVNRLQPSGFTNGATVTEVVGLTNKPCNM